MGYENVRLRPDRSTLLNDSTRLESNWTWLARTRTFFDREVAGAPSGAQRVAPASAKSKVELRRQHLAAEETDERGSHQHVLVLARGDGQREAPRVGSEALRGAVIVPLLWLQQAVQVTPQWRGLLRSSWERS